MSRCRSKSKSSSCKPQDKAKLAELFERFEFKTWRRELQEGRGARAAAVAIRRRRRRIADRPLGGSVRLRDGAHRRAAQRVAAAARRRRARRARHRDHQPRSVSGASSSGISFSVERGLRGLPAASGTATPARRSSLPLALVLERLKPWLEDPRTSQSRPEHQIRHARARQPRHRARRRRSTTRCCSRT